MPTTAEMQTQGAAVAPTRGRVLATGIALSSFSALLLELGLTRLFSVVLFYHFAFLAISIALLGFAAARWYSRALSSKLIDA